MGKVDDMRAWNEWREYHRALKRDKAVDKLSPVERMRRLEKLEKDPVSWMLFFFAEYTRHPFTSFQKKAIRRITSNPEWYEVLSWSRELAKSTIVFMCIMYLVLTKRKRNVLLVSNSHENATRLLDPYKKSFEQNSLLKAYYGDLREAGNWTADEFSLTSGAVSALDREVTMSNNVTMNLIQTDCAINSGNSGGALFNLYGEVIGITNAKYSGSSGSGASIDNIGFAIPINSVRSIVDSIIEKGYVAKPYIGVMVADVSDEAKNYGTPAGAAVASVTEGGPADKAGLQANDIITAVDGTEISGKSDLSSIIADHAAGDKLTLSVYRQGQTLTLTVEIGEQTTSAIADQQDSQQSQSQQQTPGFFGFGG